MGLFGDEGSWEELGVVIFLGGVVILHKKGDNFIELFSYKIHDVDIF